MGGMLLRLGMLRLKLFVDLSPGGRTIPPATRLRMEAR